MTKEREALKLALDALEAHADIGIKANKVITAIREALAQPEQEPVAWRYRMPVEDGHWVWNYATYIDDPKDQRCEPLYTTPPQRKPWVGLTEQEHTDIAVECGCMSSDWVFYGATVERLLKEKNS